MQEEARTLEKEAPPSATEAFYLTVMKLNKSVSLCWMALVGLDIYYCLHVIELHY